MARSPEGDPSIYVYVPTAASKQHAGLDLSESRVSDLSCSGNYEAHRRTTPKFSRSAEHDGFALTWRSSAPDENHANLFTLKLIGIDDRLAIKQFYRAKIERKKCEIQSRRRQSGLSHLHLDRLDSQSSESSRSSKCSRSESRNDSATGNAGASTTRTQPRTNSRDSPKAVIETYHLHKSVVGNERAKLLSRRVKNNHSDHSVKVPKCCLPAIPILLDHIYGIKAGEGALTADTSIALRFLSNLFGMPTLHEVATSFLRDDLRASAPRYLQLADIYWENKLIDASTKVCAEDFHETKMTALAQLEPDQLTRILHSTFFEPRDNTSSKIASYCRCQLHNLSRETLLSLTDEHVMPSICPNDALFFVQLMLRLGVDVINESSLIKEERRLYLRCVEVSPTIVKGVISSMTRDMESAKNLKFRGRAIRSDYLRLPAEVKVDMLEFALAETVS